MKYESPKYPIMCWVCSISLYKWTHASHMAKHVMEFDAAIDATLKGK